MEKEQLVNTKEYVESTITFAARDVPDLYAVHRQVMMVTHGDKAITYAPVGLRVMMVADENKDITYAPVGQHQEGRMVVALRAMPDVKMPDGILAERKPMENGMSFTIHAGIRLVKRSDRGERMPTVEEALEKWTHAVTEGGFTAGNTHMVDSTIAFYHQRLNHHTKLPFWVVSSELTVADAGKAAETMVKGIGRSRGLGFGMLMVNG